MDEFLKDLGTQEPQFDSGEGEDNQEVEEVEASEEETQETEDVKPEPKQDPSTYQYWQSQADKKERMLMEEMKKRELLEKEIEQIKAQLAPKEEKQPLVKPTPPQSDDPIEQLEYARKLAEYNEQLVQEKFSHLEKYYQELENERQARLAQEEQAKARTYFISEFVKAGLTPEEATLAFNDYAKASDDPSKYFSDLAEFWRFRQQKNNLKAKNVDKRISKQNNIPPLGVYSGEEDELNQNDTKDIFLKDLKRYEQF